MNKLKMELDFIKNSGFFDDTSQVIADLIMRNAPVQSPMLAITTALTVKSLQENHTCMQIKEFAGKKLESANGAVYFQLPDYEQWRKYLLQSDLHPAATVLSDADSEDIVPESLLVIDRAGGCYLQRQWAYEHSIAVNLLKRAEEKLPLPHMEAGKLHNMISFFPTGDEHPETDFQQLALLAAMRSKLLVLSGGPGTGKTTVAAVLLALKLEQEPDLRIFSAAPTAKAAVTLTSSLQENARLLNTDETVRQKILQIETKTIHRLLNFQHKSNEFKYNAENPLICDLLLLDECSMIPQNIMAQLLEALPASAGVILLGDRHQLSSVEAGSVLADICSAAIPNCGDAELVELFARQTSWQINCPDKAVFDAMPLTGSLVELTENHRFVASASKLGVIAGLIRNLSGQAEESVQAADTIAELSGNEFEFHALSEKSLKDFLRAAVDQVRLPGGEKLADLPRLAAAGNRESLDRAFRLLNSFMLLSPGRQGKFGFERLNELLIEMLQLPDGNAAGVPLLILKNDYRVGLFNGDIGLIGCDESGAKRVFFPAAADDDTARTAYRSYAIEELPDYNYAFAMSVHKSQGCGFDEVVFVLAGAEQLLTREMVYTAMTRARKKLCCFGSKATLAEALAKPTRRMSNLSSRLQKDLQD